ncbi:MAG: hypothetical protein CMP36_01335 [Rickettsiales bacterium]|nr:hypothetical protein [Rickettsiales bacterium]OUV82157.1 MAG: hypothetical protein CBC91_01775 [Rickettsiales bacterium TMED131]
MINKIKRLKVLFIIFFITLVILLILKFTGSNNDLVESNAKPFIVKTKKIALQELNPEYFFYGNIRAKSKIEVITKLPGKIIKVSPKVLSNSYFKKEEIIFELDSFNFQQELIEKEAKLKNLENELDSVNLIYLEVKQQQELSKKNYERKKKLFGDIVTRKNLEDAATNLSLNNAKVLDIDSKMQTLRANIDIAQTQVKLANRNLKDTKYKAPFNGKLSNSSIEVGAELISGKLLGEFINTKNLNVEFFIGENVYTEFNNLLDKEVRVIWKKSNFKDNYSAKVFYIDSTINKDRAGLNVRAKLESVDLSDPVKPGVFVEVMLKGNTVSNAFLVDENYIYEDKYVLTLENQTVLRKKIKIKGVIGDKIIVTGDNLNNKNLILTRINNISALQNVVSHK